MVARQIAQHCQGGRVGPVQIVDHQEYRQPRREHRGHRVEQEALLAARFGSHGRWKRPDVIGQFGNEAGELTARTHRRRQGVDVGFGDQLTQDFDEREIRAEAIWAAPSPQHRAVFVRAPSELRDEPRLPDP